MSFLRLLTLALLLLPVLVVAQEIASPTEDQFHPLQLQYDAPGRNTHPVATSPLRRTAPIEARLTCEDYSKLYFSRHPAMAQVCGVNVAEGASPTTSETPSATQP